MTSARQSNLDRRQKREECRQALSEHINGLGLQVQPSEVRLNPRTTDPYAWKFIPEKELHLRDLFARKLSDHSISTYRLLCDEVGKTFEAIRNPTVDVPLARAAPQPGASFSSKISQLEARNAKLVEELAEWRDKANSSGNRKEEAEAEVIRWKEACDQLGAQVQGYAAQNKELQDAICRYSQCIDQVIPLLHGVQVAMPTGSLEG